MAGLMAVEEREEQEKEKMAASLRCAIYRNETNDNEKEAVTANRPIRSFLLPLFSSNRTSSSVVKRSFNGWLADEFFLF
uniref:Uncharacterized protein n=1 Tax=Caenorhabditis tropicalis TaxID=1561998 RepID=A0A1I7UI01_9PELO